MWRKSLRLAGVLVMMGSLVAVGCGRSPEAKKARYLERGDNYIQQGKYSDAIIAYRNALRYEQTNARAIRQLGLALYQLGQVAQAYPFLRKSQELEPGNGEVRLKLGTIYLAANSLKQAREATFVLETEPDNLEALTLWAGTVTTPEDREAAIRRLEATRAAFEGRAKFHVALGTLYFGKQDLTAAERAFTEAVAREPKAIEAHSALGGLYLAKQDTARAEEEYKTVAEIAPPGSRDRLRLADFYLFTQRRDEAKESLRRIVEKTPDYIPAWRRLAEIGFAEQRYDDSIKALRMVLAKNPTDLDGLFLRGRVHLAKRETTDAVQDFQQVLKLEPGLATAHVELALAHLQAGSVQQAKAELKEAMRLAPSAPEATLLLAELNIQTGASQAAIEDLAKFITKQPDTVRAYALLGSAYLATRDAAKATEAYRKIVMLAPKGPLGHYLVALGLRAQGDSTGAKKEFEAALALSPSYVDPVAQLVQIAWAEKRPDEALERVKKQMTLAPNSAGLQDLLGRVYLARGEQGPAEAAFLKAIELEPRLVDPYLRLGQLYGASGKYDEAVSKLNELLKANPKNVVALMLAGIVYGRKGDIPKAQESYERALAVDPRLALAANNLAYLLSEHGGDKEKALQLAQTAKEAAPDEANFSDTLGWILYKRGVYQRATALLRESATKLPDNPEVQYHFGMASLKGGDTKSAQTALSRAVNAGGSFSGKDEARKALAGIK